mmetsp:Transcript_62118/g.161073  ORF Transcript_62118/g.161073 Transcript_62118/m.161073 type:complete len:550 (+) Transcript_62118:70-1719(+)
MEKPSAPPLARRAATATALAVVALLASGCGDSKSPTPAPTPAPGPAPGPTPAPGPMECSAALKRGHCGACEWTGASIACTACTGDYKLDKDPSSPDLFCTYNCSEFVPAQTPGRPANAQSHNGIEWPAVCFPDSVSRFLTIGDWGGVCGWGDQNKCLEGVVPPVCAPGTEGEPGKPCPMPNRPGNTYIHEIEGRAQSLVSNRMLARAKELKKANTPSRFIVNVGDNFYPGGIDAHCGKPDGSVNSTQFAQIWKAMYPEELTEEMEWWSVLGNHDYGGVCYIKGWDQQIFYTYHQDKWLLPAQYWKRTVQYANFKADFFFIDGNLYDTHGDDNHNICSKIHNPGQHCELSFYPGTGGDCAPTGPHGPDECKSWFEALWQNNYDWLHEEVPKSDADWQILVSHYPAHFDIGVAGKSHITWAEWLTPMGIDLYISGHTHEQKVYYGDMGPGMNMKDTAWVITGGGGGVTSEQLPTADGNDDAYGFMEMEISLHELKITAYSHGGAEEKVIIRNQTTVKPVPRQSHSELVAAGLLKAMPARATKDASEIDLVV